MANAASKQPDYWAEGRLIKALNWTIFRTQTLFKSSRCWLQQSKRKLAEWMKSLTKVERNITFACFFFDTLKRLIFEGGIQMKLSVNQQIYFGKRWTVKLSDALFIWPPLAQFSHRVSTTDKQVTFLSCKYILASPSVNASLCSGYCSIRNW